MRSDLRAARRQSGKYPPDERLYFVRRHRLDVQAIFVGGVG